VKTTRKQTRLKRSKLESLFRHANGVYYARIKVNDKSKERSLKTTDYNLAATLLPETLRELRGASEAHQAGTLAHSIQAEADRDDPDLKPATQHYYRQVAKSIIDTLPPHVAAKKLPQVTVGDLRAWRDVLCGQGQQDPPQWSPGPAPARLEPCDRTTGSRLESGGCPETPQAG